MRFCYRVTELSENSVEFDKGLTFNNTMFTLNTALAGMGLDYLPEDTVERHYREAPQRNAARRPPPVERYYDHNGYGHLGRVRTAGDDFGLKRFQGPSGRLSPDHWPRSLYRR